MDNHDIHTELWDVINHPCLNSKVVWLNCYRNWDINEWIYIPKKTHYQGSLLRPWSQKMTVFFDQRWHLDIPFTCADKDLCRWDQLTVIFFFLTADLLPTDWPSANILNLTTTEHWLKATSKETHTVNTIMKRSQIKWYFLFATLLSHFCLIHMKSYLKWYLRYGCFQNFLLKIQYEGHGKIKGQGHTE